MATSAAPRAAAGCQAAVIQPALAVAPDGWLLLAALVVCAAGRWSR